MSKTNSRKILAQEKDLAESLLLKMSLEELVSLDFKRFFVETKQDGKKAFAQIDDTYTRKRIYNKVLEYKKDQKRFDTAVTNAILWKLLFPYLNEYYEQQQTPYQILNIGCVASQFNVAVDIFKTSIRQYRIRIDNAISSCGLWQALMPYICDVPMAYDISLIAFTSKNMFNGVKPMYGKVLDYQNRINTAVGNSGLWEAVFRYSDLTIFDLNKLLRVSKSIYSCTQNIMIQIIKPVKKGCEKCSKTFVLYETARSLSQVRCCAECDESNTFPVVLGYCPGNWKGQTFISCARCSAIFFLRRDYRGNYPRCPMCRF